MCVTQIIIYVCNINYDKLLYYLYSKLYTIYTIYIIHILYYLIYIKIYTIYINEKVILRNICNKK